MNNRRTMNMGRLAELEIELKILRTEIHADATAICLHFEPIDMALAYVDKIDPFMLKVFVKRIEKNMEKFKAIKAEIEQLKVELGQR